MPDESAIIKEFLYQRLIANADLIALLPRGLDAIGSDINPIDFDDEFILISKEDGTDEKVLNRGGRHLWHGANGIVDVYGAKGSNYDSISPIVKQVDTTLGEASGFTSEGYVECERIHLRDLSEYEGGQLIPRMQFEFDMTAQAT